MKKLFLFGKIFLAISFGISLAFCCLINCQRRSPNKRAPLRIIRENPIFEDTFRDIIPRDDPADTFSYWPTTKKGFDSLINGVR